MDTIRMVQLDHPNSRAPEHQCAACVGGNGNAGKELEGCLDHPFRHPLSSPNDALQAAPDCRIARTGSLPV